MVKYSMEYKQERFILNRLCEFSDRDTESEFMEYDKTASLNFVRFFMLLMGFTFALFSLSDYFFYGQGRVFFVSLGLRGTALFITVAAFFLLGRIGRYHHTLVMVTTTQMVVFVIYLVNLYNQQSNKPEIQFMTVMLFILAVFLIPNKWKNCLIGGCIIWWGYIVFCIVFSSSAVTSSLAQRGIYLSISFMTCAIFLFGREKSRRRQFAAEKLLEFMSITDRLTNIYNRGRFEHVLGLWIKNMRHAPFSLLLFDIDNFKKVNDRYGHTVGDQVLVGISNTVSANIRDEDLFARWGGEEFVIIFGDTGIEKAAELAERLRIAVEANPCSEAGVVTISIGIAEYRQGETITDFVNRADEKMYEAKKAGKNRVMA